MTDRISIYVQLYCDSWTSVRHLEEQRSQFVNFTVASIAVIVAALGVGFDDLSPNERSKLVIVGYAALSLFGLYGFLVLEKIFERISFLMGAMNEIAGRMDGDVASLELQSLVVKVTDSHVKTHPYLSYFRYATYWNWPFLFSFFLGLIMIAVEVKYR